jgi:hypothetical protein
VRCQDLAREEEEAVICGRGIFFSFDLRIVWRGDMAHDLFQRGEKRLIGSRSRRDAGSMWRRRRQLNQSSMRRCGRCAMHACMKALFCGFDDMIDLHGTILTITFLRMCHWQNLTDERSMQRRERPLEGQVVQRKMSAGVPEVRVCNEDGSCFLVRSSNECA